MKKGDKRCSYCNRKAVEVIYVCPDHAKALDRVATRRKKLPIPVPVVEPKKIVEPEKVVEPEKEKENEQE